jgi:sugar-specific transcriptional regulator TrmB
VQFDFSSRYTSILKPLGLTDYEIRVFIKLIEIGPTNYRVLVKQSNVPTGKIYQVLSGLESKGFIETIQEKPKIFKATEPKKAIRRRLRQIEDDYLDLEHRISEVMHNLQSEYSQKYDKTQGTVTRVLVGSKAFESVVKENLSKAENEVLLSSTELISQLHLEETFKDLQVKGVCVNALSPGLQTANNGFSNGHSEELANLGVNIRVSTSFPFNYITVDNQTISLLLNGNEEETCIQIQSQALSRRLREIFTQKWENGRTLTQNHKNHTAIGNGLSTGAKTLLSYKPN